MRGAGRVVFAAVLLLVAGTINIIYGIGALDDAKFFVHETRYILTNLHTLGWVLIILGVIQLTGGLSLMSGRPYGRVIGIFAGSLAPVLARLASRAVRPADAASVGKQHYERSIATGSAGRPRHLRL